MSARAGMRGRYRVILCGLLLGLVMGGASAPAAEDPPRGRDPHYLFQEGNEAYERGDFAGAVLLYRRALGEARESASLHFNLGNAYLKLGELGEAVASYRRAERLAPRAGDIRENLALARARRIDLVPGEGLAPLGALRRFINRWISLGELLLVADLLYYIAAGLLIWRLVRGRGSRPLRLALSTVGPASALFLLLLGVECWVRHSSPEAVVVVPQMEARSGPGTEYTAEFTLHEGTEVTVEECRGGWCVILLNADLRGWVEREDLELISEGPGYPGSMIGGELSHAGT